MKTIAYAMVAGVVLLVLLVEAVDENKDKSKEVWGDTFRGVALSISLPREQFKVGEEIDIAIKFKNFGDKEVSLLGEDRLSDYRAGLFRADGSALAKHEWARKADEPPSGPWHGSRSVARLSPGEQYGRTVPLKTWFDVKDPGQYYLVVVGRIWSWDEGSAMSNLVRFSVVAADEQKKP